jgi:hypothetical protein
VLLDECVDWRLGRELASHEVKTARQMGWTTLKNGELLGLASARPGQPQGGLFGGLSGLLQSLHAAKPNTNGLARLPPGTAEPNTSSRSPIACSRSKGPSTVPPVIGHQHDDRSIAPACGVSIRILLYTPAGAGGFFEESQQVQRSYESFASEDVKAAYPGARAWHSF